MACTSATLSGIALDCGNVGGIKKIYAANTADVSTIAFDATGEVTALTMVATKTFKTYSFRKGNASFTTTGARDDKNGTYFAKTEITAQFNKMDKAKRTELVELVKAATYIIIQDQNNEYWFVGKDSYVSLMTGNGQSGANMADGNFYNIVLSSDTEELPNTILLSVVETAGVPKAEIFS